MSSAWAHFTSWWVYPAVSALAIILLGLAIAQVKPDVVLVLFRLTVVLSGLAYAYDHGWRRRRGSPRKRDHGRSDDARKK